MIQIGAQDLLKQSLQMRKAQIIRDFYETDCIMSMSVFLHEDTLYCYIG